MSAQIKAYAVQEEDEGTGGIYYATSAIAARRIGANDLNHDFEYVTCRRAAWADEFSPGPCPKLVMIAAGWWFECHGCNVRINYDLEDEDGRRLDPVEEGHGIWCTSACRNRDLADRAETKRRQITAIARVTEEVARRYRGVLLEGSPHAYVTRDSDADYAWWTEREVVISFSFPGQKHGTVRWHEEVGGKSYLMVPVGDLDAWNAWRAEAVR